MTNVMYVTQDKIYSNSLLWHFMLLNSNWPVHYTWLELYKLDYLKKSHSDFFQNYIHQIKAFIIWQIKSVSTFRTWWPQQWGVIRKAVTISTCSNLFLKIESKISYLLCRILNNQYAFRHVHRSFYSSKQDSILTKFSHRMQLLSQFLSCERLTQFYSLWN